MPNKESYLQFIHSLNMEIVNEQLSSLTCLNSQEDWIGPEQAFYMPDEFNMTSQAMFLNDNNLK